MAEAFVTPEGRLRYARSLWSARRFQNNPSNPAKYSCSLAVSKSDPQIQDLVQKYNAVALTVEGAQPGPQGGLTVLPYGKKSCLMDGAVRHPGEAFYADKLILSCSRPEEDGAPQVLLDANTPVIDKGEVYDGCNARIHLNFYAYKGGSGGINAGLYAVMKTGDNERLGNAAPDSAAAFGGFPGAGQSIPTPPPAPTGFGVTPWQPDDLPTF